MRAIKRAFGRLVEFDERSRGFPIRALIPRGSARRSRIWPCYIVLDQGAVAACTGFSVCHEAAAEPVEVKGLENADGLALYRRAQQLDQWPGEDYEGSSVLGAMKAGQERGWYGAYRWAFGEADLALAIGYCGPAVLGISWYAGMSRPDAGGKIAPTGKLLGGHAILCNGYNARTSQYRLHNSWGPGWGLQGACWIARKDLARLLAEDGEACIPVVRKNGTEGRGQD